MVTVGGADGMGERGKQLHAPRVLGRGVHGQGCNLCQQSCMRQLLQMTQSPMGSALTAGKIMHAGHGACALSKEVPC